MELTGADIVFSRLPLESSRARRYFAACDFAKITRAGEPLARSRLIFNLSTSSRKRSSGKSLPLVAGKRVEKVQAERLWTEPF